ncbi:MAG: outer membrane beta-barrel protein [Prevotella sp.]|nr:outer membrane beta-barrel protein [Prevotella sp.]
MRKFKKTFLVSALLASTLASSAQNLERQDGWYGSIYLGGGAGTFYTTGDSQSFTDFHVGLAPIGYGVDPVCFEMGVESHFINYNSNGTKFSMAFERVPITARCRIAVSDNMYLSPFAGVYADWNIKGELKDKSSGEKINVFKKKEWPSSDDIYKRFQLGWQAGVRFDTSIIFIGLSYSRDFTNLQKSTKLKSGIALLNFGVYIN